MLFDEHAVVFADNISQSIKASVQKELEQYSHANTLFLRHLFLQAEGHGVDSLKVDPNVVHDEYDCQFTQRIWSQSIS